MILSIKLPNLKISKIAYHTNDFRQTQFLFRIILNRIKAKKELN